ncbi:hypothetical protein H4R33_006275 [Dimargaris cristalligena]|nr:hypothetical protein H4R33_006275 [Dimargaris cristalligena]
MEAFLKYTYQELQPRSRAPPKASNKSRPVFQTPPATQLSGPTEYEAVISTLKAAVPRNDSPQPSHIPLRPPHPVVSSSIPLVSASSPPPLPLPEPQCTEGRFDDTADKKPKFGFSTFTLFRKKKRQLPKIQMPFTEDTPMNRLPPVDSDPSDNSPNPETRPAQYTDTITRAPANHRGHNNQPLVHAWVNSHSDSINEVQMAIEDNRDRPQDRPSRGGAVLLKAKASAPNLSADSRPNPVDLLPAPPPLSILSTSVTPTPLDPVHNPPVPLTKPLALGHVIESNHPYRRSHRYSRSVGGSFSRSMSTSVDPRMASRTSFIATLPKNAQDACVGYEPASVAATTRARSTYHQKRSALFKRLGWFAIDLDHGRDIVPKLSGAFMDALQVRFVSLDTPAWKLASLSWEDAESQYIPHDALLKHIRDPRSDSLCSPTAGLLILSKSVKIHGPALVNNQPPMWWSGDIEDADFEEYYEVLIKGGKPRRHLKAASLRALVFRLASPHETDIEFMNDFLRGFRFLAHPVDVLRLLIVRYLHCAYAAQFTSERLRPSWAAGGSDSGAPSPIYSTFPGRPTPVTAMDHQRPIIQIRILNVIKRWFDHYLDDFKKFTDLSNLLILFLAHIQFDPRRSNFVKTMLAKVRAQTDVVVEDILHFAYPGSLPIGLCRKELDALSLASSNGSQYMSAADLSQSAYSEHGLESTLCDSKYSLSSAGGDESLTGRSLVMDTNIKPAPGYKRLFFGSKQRKLAAPSGKVYPSSGLSRANRNIAHLSVLDMEPKELFHQLTLMEHTMFRAISIDEFCHHGKCKDSGERQALAPKLNNLIRWFNRMAIWVAKQILTALELPDRIRLVQNFILIAHQCLIWHNYNTCFEIVSGLTLSSVKRLHQTWAGVSNKSQMMLNQLNTIMSQRPNYKMYRACLRGVWDTNGVGIDVSDDSTPTKSTFGAGSSRFDNLIDFQVESSGVLHMGSHVAMLPFIGVHLTDLLYCDEGNVSYIDPSRLNEAYPVAVGSNTLVSSSSIARSIGKGSLSGSTQPRTSHSSGMAHISLMTPNSANSSTASNRSDMLTLALVSPSFHITQSFNSHMRASTRPSRLVTPLSPAVKDPMWSPTSTIFKARDDLSDGLPIGWWYGSNVVGSPKTQVLHFAQVPLVNCSKLRLMSAMLQKIQAAQQNKYPFKENAAVQSWIRTEVDHIFHRQILPATPFAFQSLHTQRVPVRIIPNIHSLSNLEGLNDHHHVLPGQPSVSLQPQPTTAATWSAATAPTAAIISGFAMQRNNTEMSTLSSSSTCVDSRSSMQITPFTFGSSDSFSTKFVGAGLPPPPPPSDTPCEFVQVGDDPEEWESWLHKLSRHLEPPLNN